ncbi:heptaprenyl diphosphate synthase component 1 [Solibacillus sp. FSL W8-0474]|uniref:heptaprenyl diphosphate synthase component 1 n=1 Tax=Solibacillus sp. FSL W8-0474 TaxID=2975336 RepID=UPI0030F517CB
MSATSIIQSVQTLQSNILQHVHHRALLQNVGQPTLQEEQLFFIQLPFLNGAEMTDDHKVSAITVGIVHASLLEHERVLEVDATSKEQQLIVLSGDYYSGRYYQLLAQSGNIRLIQKLSKGIVNRCEHQIRIYETQTRSVEQWIHSLTVIESALISQYYDVYGYNAYTELMENTLTFIRLKKEYGLIQDAKRGFLYKALASADNPAILDSTMEWLHEQLITRKQQVLEVVKQSHIHEDLKHSIEQYITL